MTSLQIELPDEVLTAIVDAVSNRVRAELADTSPWMTRKEAADYLRVPISRLEKDRTVPAHRWEGRILYSRTELDEWLRAQ